MALLSVANLVFSHGDRIILDGLSLTLDQGQRVGLVGRNGCGKSTLMKMIAGVGGFKQDAGQIQLSGGATCGYLAQEFAFSADTTLRQEAAKAFEKLQLMIAELDKLAHDMTHAQGSELDKLMKRYEQVEHKVSAAGGYAVDHRVDETLHGLGLTDDLFDVPVSGLSGGQKGRLALAKLLLTEPDLLLLDEPTNHLDIAGRQWLEDFLREYRGAVIVVSHDRWLLDRSVNRICELEEGKIVDYPGNYAAFREQRALRRLAQQRAFEKQQENFKKEQAYIDRYRAGQRAKQAHGRETRLHRMIKDQSLERPIELSTLELQFRPGTRPGDLIVTSEDVSKAYGPRVLFNKVTLVVQRGARIGIIGPNGAGKTTLVATLLGQAQADSGMVKVGPSVNVGHYRQTHDHLPRDMTIVDYLRQFMPGHLEQLARNLAGAFLFSGDQMDKNISVLSGGEKSRVVLASLMVGGHNVLVLDEPTNHLDIPSAERLEFALMQFTGIDEEEETEDGEEKKSGGYGSNAPNPGTMMLITHDRMLLDNLCDQLLVFDGHGNVRHFLGTYSEYLVAQQTQTSSVGKPKQLEPAKDKAKEKQREEEAAKNKAAQEQAKSAAAQKSSGSHSKSSGGTGAASKMSQETLEKRIVEIEKELSKIDTELAAPDTYRDGARVKVLQQKRDELAAQLNPLEQEWERRAENN